MVKGLVQQGVGVVKSGLAVRVKKILESLRMYGVFWYGVRIQIRIFRYDPGALFSIHGVDVTRILGRPGLCHVAGV